MNINYKKFLSFLIFLVLSVFMVGILQAQTPTYDQWGVATPRIYHMSTYGDRTTISDYFIAPAAVSANDTMCCIGATQTLVGKTLTSPTLTTPTLTTPVITGVIDASDGMTVAPGAGIDVESAGVLKIGDTTATTIGIGGTAATTVNLGASGALTRAINVGTGTGADTINIGTGGTVADDINIGDALADVDIVGLTLDLTASTVNIVGQLHESLYHWSDEFDYEANAVELGNGLQADYWTVSGTNDVAGMYLYTAGVGGTLDISTDTAADDSSAISGLPNYRVITIL